MPDRSISVSDVAAASAKSAQVIQRKGPARATAAQFLPLDQRRGMYRAFHEGGRSVEQIAAISGVKRLVVQEVLRWGRDVEAGKMRALTLVRRAA